MPGQWPKTAHLEDDETKEVHEVSRGTIAGTLGRHRIEPARERERKRVGRVYQPTLGHDRGDFFVIEAGHGAD